MNVYVVWSDQFNGYLNNEGFFAPDLYEARRFQLLQDAKNHVVEDGDQVWMVRILMRVVCEVK